ncbi:fatty-acyl-CoA synthase [Alteribacillus persepolensis]|uniref:Fatty-acyl-CoA synthase n=1 Tax=Alteribacillus persepolensis TaxID=568899 RepID=A0A1G8DFQ2_9BACI|nr:fatty acid--CoA ligase [Alteribacillus persepolensis]SDH56140.1 fatty-acyl-CoA synthase [Alteribacillus persepolensis]
MYVPLVLTQFLDRAKTWYGDNTAVVDGGRRVTYRELYDRVQQLSHGLKSLNIKKGDKVAYLAPNTLEMLEGFYGVFQLGAVMTPLNTRLKPSDYVFILNHSESSVLFVEQELLPLIEPVIDELETVKTIIVHGADANTNGHRSYNQWLKQFSKEPVIRAEVDEHDTATLLYTSGTTGKPKGVLLSHRSNYLHAMSAMHHLRVSDSDTLLHILPMFHVNGWGSPFYYTANGAAQVMQRKVEPASIFEKITQHNVTVAHMAPTVLNMLLEYYSEHQPPLPKQDMRIVIAGSAPPPSFVAMVEEELGWEFIQVYGMTEISPLITVSTIRPQHDHLSSGEKQRTKAKTGYAMIGSEVKVVDSGGKEVPSDGKAVGEIIVRSNNVMEGYLKNPEATSDTIKNGWLYTGDMAVVDENGYIDIVDRKKDVIISGGENISSIEVEGCLYAHPDIVEAAVIALPHEKWGEVPHAVVVKREDSAISEEEIIQFAKKRLAHFKAPKSISFIEALPKTASGKIQKVQLRDQFWNHSERKVN